MALKPYLTLVVSGLALGAVALISAPAKAGRVDAYGPFPVAIGQAKVNSTTYYSCRSGSHSALDMIRYGGCGTASVRSMLKSYRYYRYYGGCGYDCNSTPTSCNGGAGNYFVVTGSSGYNFRILHNNYWSGYSKSKYCSKGCTLAHYGSTGGSTGPHAHVDNRRYTTRLTRWYTMVGTTCGTRADSGKIVGKPQLSL